MQTEIKQFNDAMARDAVEPEGGWAVELKHLNHFYGRRQILFDMNAQLAPNKIYGLLGRNGAGKTTLINVLSAQIFQKSGEALIFGHNAFEHVETLKKICFIREKSNTPDALRISNALSTASMIYPNWDASYAEHLVELFMLEKKKKFKSLSRGMESSLGLIIGLASRAELTVFDEPSLGLDAAAREYFYDELIHDVEAHPRTVIISTHMIEEVAPLLEDVVIVDRGRVLTQAPVEKLLSCAACISGPADKVVPATQGMHILHKEDIGNLCMVSVWSPEGVDASRFDGLDVNQLPLQKLFVYMTEGGIF